MSGHDVSSWLQISVEVDHSVDQNRGGDETRRWEVGQFLTLATQCHPLVLETLLAPVVTLPINGATNFALIEGLFPAIWSPDQAFEAFTKLCPQSTDQVSRQER